MKCELKTFFSVIHPKNDYVPTQEHNCYEIVFYENGMGRTTIGGEIFDYDDGSIIMISPDVHHDELAVTQTTVWFCLFECDEPLGLYADVLIRCDEEQKQEFLRIFIDIQKEYSRRELGYDQMLNNLTECLVLHMIRCSGERKSKIDQMGYVCTYIKEYCANKINFEIFAQNIGYSYSRFRHLFKEKMGISPQKYQLNFRIAKAKQLLETTDMPVSNVAGICGFRSSTKFIEAFKSKSGVTPEKYRRILNSTSKDVLNFDEIEH